MKRIRHNYKAVTWSQKFYEAYGVKPTLKQLAEYIKYIKLNRGYEKKEKNN